MLGTRWFIFYKPLRGAAYHQGLPPAGGWKTYMTEDAQTGYSSEDAVRDAAVVIERMANGASRAECAPEMDRFIAHIRTTIPRAAVVREGTQQP